MNEAIKPTQGPWIVDDAQPGDAFRYVMHGDDDSFGYICRISTNGNANAESDARLIAEAGTVFHNTGLSPVQLVERVNELEEALRKYEDVREDMFTFFLSNGIFNQWGKRYDCSALNNAHLQASAALAKCEGVE